MAVPPACPCPIDSVSDNNQHSDRELKRELTGFAAAPSLTLRKVGT